ncbi:hypothetical protein SPBR_09056 [Sporothrix brasiliensis 5110]|uniref:ABM domain-containing protein n=1 Tax=Sporothrix brasiliensis 5110 TaxID=1398154 RepID=A0A0C2IXY3_9PEZI|nr:uncharacterized protein SPBR_09056 [Sporothrix brasiliensis 5110]KIH89892.1 hypothetical protein SPBR_09056 [Sporothrix brasiliensis 5110]
MSRQFVFARLPLHTAQKRDELLRVVAPVTAFAHAGEPGVSKYAALVARDDPTDAALYMIEEYDDQAAFDSHVATDSVGRFVQWLGVPGHVDGAPVVWFTAHTDLEYVSPQLDRATDAYVVVSTYRVPKKDVREQFAGAFTAARRRGALWFGVYTDKEKGSDVVVTAEAYSTVAGYAGPASLLGAGAHVASTAVLQVKHGFLYKRGVTSAL